MARDDRRSGEVVSGDDYQKALDELGSPASGPSVEELGRVAAARVLDDPDIMEQPDIILRVAMVLVGNGDEPEDEHLVLARAVIASLREPTEAMVRAGSAFIASAAWPKMIDEALK